VIEVDSDSTFQQRVAGHVGIRRERAAFFAHGRQGNFQERGERDGFRRAFANFDADAVARFDPADVKRLLDDVSIVRNRAKIEATVGNARAVLQLRATGRPLISIFRPTPRASRRKAPVAWSDVPSTTPEAVALARELKGRGFRFLGPTTLYALMQACGVVDDHLAACPIRPAAERARRAAGLI